MKYIDKIISEIHEITINREMIEVIKRIEKFSKQEELKTFGLNDGKIEFLRSPSTFSPHRGYGRFMISLKGHKNKTSVICKILPYDGSFGYIIISGLVLMTLWTIVGLLINAPNGLFIIIIGWILGVLGTAIYYFLNKLSLRSFYKYFVRKISE